MNKEKNQKQKLHISSYLKITNRILVVLVLLSGVSYLAGINDLAIKHFVVQENKRKLYTLQDANNLLENKVMALSSFSSINKKVASLNMVKVDQIDYININTLVAKR
jgi:hypothetical protein